MDPKLGKFFVLDEVQDLDPRFIPNFVCREYIGTTIHDEFGNTISNAVELAVGAKIVVTGLFGENISMLVVRPGIAEREGSQISALIEKAKDDRGVWVCSGLANLAALARMDFVE